MLDTPGHLDLATEVVTAARIADGAIIIVDVVEGVKSQTKQSIKTAFEQGISMILLINKIDRLFLELHLQARDAFGKVWKIIEATNAYLAQLQNAAAGTEVKTPQSNLFPLFNCFRYSA